MNPSFDRAYFQARLNRNRQLASRSKNAQIRAIHLEYVRLYEHLLERDEIALPA